MVKIFEILHAKNIALYIQEAFAFKDESKAVGVKYALLFHDLMILYFTLLNGYFYTAILLN